MKNNYKTSNSTNIQHKKLVKNVIGSLLFSQLIIGCSTEPVQKLWTKGKAADEAELKQKEEYYQSELQKEVINSVQAVDKNISSRRVLLETSPFVNKKLRFVEVNVEDEKNLVSLKATQQPFMSLLEGIVTQKGYSLVAAENVDLQKKITVDLQSMSFNQAVKQVAFFAGYVAIVNDKERTVTVSETATYTFRVPTNLLQKLTTTYNVGGNPIASSGGGGGGQVQAASSVAPIKAQFNVEGGLQNGTPASLNTFLSRMAGKGTDVQVNGESGLILVKGNAHSLKRVQDFLEQYCDDAMKQVDIQAAIIEVTLSDDFQYGIDWQKVFSDTGFTNFSSGGVTTNATNPSVFKISAIKGSIGAVIQAIQRYSKTKIVSNPNTVLLNRSGATLFDGLQVPYVASVQSTVSAGGAGSGINQVTVQAAFATDGVSLSVQAEVLDNESVYITLIPVLSTIRSIDKLADAGGTAVTAPTQGVKQSITSVLAKSGQTVILAGNRYTADSQKNSNIPFLNDIPFFGKLFGRIGNVKEEREYVILLRATPIPAPDYNPLIAESL